MAQPLGLVPLLCQNRRARRGRRAWGNTLLVLSLFGTAWAWLDRPQARIHLGAAAVVPGPFYAYSVSYGSVPIFLPVWWPHSWYNTRYGMELLPALALGLALRRISSSPPCANSNRSWRSMLPPLIFALVALNAWQMLREHPLVYVEGTKNIDARRAYDIEIPPVLRALLAEHPGDGC